MCADICAHRILFWASDKELLGAGDAYGQADSVLCTAEQQAIEGQVTLEATDEREKKVQVTEPRS
jgi:hypothetical protein